MDVKQEILKEFQEKFQHWNGGLRMFVQDALTEREIKILDMRENHKTLEEVGKEFGVTRERVRQIEAKANEKVRMKDYFQEWLLVVLTAAEEQGYARGVNTSE